MADRYRSDDDRRRWRDDHEDDRRGRDRAYGPDNYGLSEDPTPYYREAYSYMGDMGDDLDPYVLDQGYRDSRNLGSHRFREDEFSHTPARWQRNFRDNRWRDNDRVRFGAGYGDAEERRESRFGPGGLAGRGGYSSNDGGYGASRGGFNPYDAYNTGYDSRMGRESFGATSSMAQRAGALYGGGAQNVMLQGEHRGRGPKGYQRSDARIREDICDRLSDDSHLDASDIDVEAKNCEVTLSGTVSSRFAKRHAEDLADAVSGVKHVQNNLRLKEATNMGGYPSSNATGWRGQRNDEDEDDELQRQFRSKH